MTFSAASSSSPSRVARQTTAFPPLPSCSVSVQGPMVRFSAIGGRARWRLARLHVTLARVGEPQFAAPAARVGDAPVDLDEASGFKVFDVNERHPVVSAIGLRPFARHTAVDRLKAMSA